MLVQSLSTCLSRYVVRKYKLLTNAGAWAEVKRFKFQVTSFKFQVTSFKFQVGIMQNAKSIIIRSLISINVQMHKNTNTAGC